METWEERILKAVNDRYKFLGWTNNGDFGNHKKISLKCNKDGFEWSATANTIVNGGYGCPKCSGRKALSNKEWEDRLNESGGGRFIFIDWPDGFNGAHSKARFKCLTDGHEWVADANHVFRKRSGCPECAGNRRYTENEYEEMINKSGAGRFVFIEWLGESRRAKSKVVCKCVSCRKRWSASVDSLLRTSGCPFCAKYGFDMKKDGTLYALRSICGNLIKIGISNKPEQRFLQLKKATPFEFHAVEKINGNGAEISKLEKYFHNKYESAGLSDFDGCTEWLVYTQDLAEELRSIRSNHAI